MSGNLLTVKPIFAQKYKLQSKIQQKKVDNVVEARILVSQEEESSTFKTWISE